MAGEALGRREADAARGPGRGQQPLGVIGLPAVQPPAGRPDEVVRARVLGRLQGVGQGEPEAAEPQHGQVGPEHLAVQGVGRADLGPGQPGADDDQAGLLQRDQQRFTGHGQGHVRGKRLAGGHQLQAGPLGLAQAGQPGRDQVADAAAERRRARPAPRRSRGGPGPSAAGRPGRVRAAAADSPGPGARRCRSPPGPPGHSSTVSSSSPASSSLSPASSIRSQCPSRQSLSIRPGSGADRAVATTVAPAPARCSSTRAEPLSSKSTSSTTRSSRAPAAAADTRAATSAAVTSVG